LVVALKLCIALAEQLEVVREVLLEPLELVLGVHELLRQERLPAPARRL